MFSRRMHWRASPNALTRAVEAARARGESLLDLTVSNPTAVGIDYPREELSEALRRAAAAPYAPEPLGLPSARAALAAELSRADDSVDPDDLVLTASTSEAYAFLFKLLANPGDEIVTHTPSYPLLDSLTELESLRLRRFPLHPHGRRWELEASSLGSSLSDRTRALVVIHPNNPTGGYLRPAEQELLCEVAAPLEAAVISDEVFFDYRLAERAEGAGPLAARSEGLLFSLGGLSKSGGLPHWKLGWIRLGGERSKREAARAALELIADSYLSVGTPVQAALPAVLPLARRIRAAIQERLRGSLALLHTIVGTFPAMELLLPEGGWSAVLRVPRVGTDEELAIDLVARGVLVHPGYLFDFPGEGYVVVSLLTPEPVLAEGVRRMVEVVGARIGA